MKQLLIIGMLIVGFNSFGQNKTVKYFKLSKINISVNSVRNKYYQSDFNTLSYSDFLDRALNSDEFSNFEFDNYSHNILNGYSCTPYSIKAGLDIIPYSKKNNSFCEKNVFRIGIIYNKNIQAEYGHYMDNTITSEVFERQSLFYHELIDKIDITLDYTYKINFSKKLYSYLGAGLNSGVSVSSKILEKQTTGQWSSGSGIEVLYPVDGTYSENRNTIDAKSVFTIGSYIPIGLSYKFYKSVELFVEYNWGIYYQDVISGLNYFRVLHSFGGGLSININN